MTVTCIHFVLWVRRCIELILLCSFYRYLLLELRFSSAEEGHRALKAVNPKSLLAVLREAILLLHGDYGLACVQHSLNGN